VQPLLSPLGWRLLRPLLFALPPERAHELTMALAAHWSTRFDGRLAPADTAHAPHLARRHLGLSFPNPIGLAAGLDKDAVAVPLWQALGFGFIEVGTVTARPQPGNPRPRLFRLPADAALINRMGFNNAGAAAMATRLQRLRARNLLQVPLGVNIGKSKAAPADAAAADYRHSFEQLGALADYVVVNISSPNTPGLRDLQTVAEVGRLLEAIQAPNQRLERPRPLLLKLAPDLSAAAAVDCARAARDGGAAGLVLTNTTVCWDGLISRTDRIGAGGAGGGLSGAPLLRRSTALLQTVRAALGADPLLIGVGGVSDAAGVAAKLAAGADLIQVYTGLIYQGPGLIRRLLATWPRQPA